MTWFEKLMIMSVLPTSIIILILISVLRHNYSVVKFNLANALIEKEKDDPGMITFMIIISIVWPIGAIIILSAVLVYLINIVLNWFNFSLNKVPQALIKERKFWWKR